MKMPNSKPTLTPTPLDWARLAAFIDGEGCIFIGVAKSQSAGPSKKQYRATHMCVTIANTDVRLIQWLQARFGGAVSSAPSKNPNWASRYDWRIQTNEAKYILENCLELFVIKREQAEIAIAHQELVAKRRGGNNYSNAIQINDGLMAKRFELRDHLSLMKGHSTRRSDLRESQAVN